MRSSFVLSALAVATFAFATPARASTSDLDPAPPPDLWEEHRFALYGVAGFGTPVGGMGLMAEAAPARWLALDFGMGAALEDQAVQFVVQPRVRFGLDEHVGFSVGAGFATGAHDSAAEGTADMFVCDDACRYTRVHRHWDHATWFDADVALEIRSARNVALRLFGGYGFILNAPATCTSIESIDRCAEAPGPREGFGRLYAGVALGAAF